MSAIVPDRGNLVTLNFSPQSGNEQAGLRPAIVISPQLFNKWKFALVCPITNQKKGYPFEVELPQGLNVNGIILTDQVRTLDWRARNLRVVGQAPQEVVDQCITLIKTFAT